MLLALGVGLALAPSTIRNAQVSGDFIPLTTSLGPNLLMGNNATANGLCDGDMSGYGNFATCYDWVGIVHNVAKETGHPVSQNEASRTFSGITGARLPSVLEFQGTHSQQGPPV